MLFLKTVYLEYTILPTPTSHTPTLSTLPEKQLVADSLLL